MFDCQSLKKERKKLELLIKELNDKKENLADAKNIEDLKGLTELKEKIENRIKNIRLRCGVTLSAKIFDTFERNQDIFNDVREVSAAYYLVESEILPKLPRIPPKFLDLVLKVLTRMYSSKEYLPEDLGMLFSGIINKTTQEYVNNSKKQGLKEEDIEPLIVRFNVNGFEKPLDWLGYGNQEKTHLIIEGNCGDGVGADMKGGKIEVRGNCSEVAGRNMQGGEIYIKGDCRGILTANKMKGGVLIIEGKVGDFDRTAFSFFNKGKIIHQGKQVWPLVK